LGYRYSRSHHISYADVVSLAKDEWIKENKHVTHGDHMVDFGDAEPVQDVRHERLEAHVLDASDELGRLEVLVGRVSSTLTQVVDEISGYV
jgi:hypothetical protein